MILDNEKYRKVHEWIIKYTEEGTVDIVTGYFTVGALAYLSQEINHKIAKFRLVLGDIVNLDQIESRPLDLLNENITYLPPNKYIIYQLEQLNQNKFYYNKLNQNEIYFFFNT